ncbi:prenyltransferase [Thermopetrobacter sp. TC1]|uniref:prenyltransferase n=1 Tax=Thermopetrobacter sp. TC1 TaxID=1495045 RepID=UPI00056F6D89|nr:prenyltransferase [Thermopetrobacter sp. TC1]
MPDMRESTWKSWLKLSRPEFHTVGVFPLLLGAALGYRASGSLEPVALALALLATVLIMLVTYWTGEVFDYDVDALSARLEKNRFSGGTLVLQTTGLAREHVLKAAWAAALLALAVGVWLAWGMGYGSSLFVAGAAGGAMGFFYSTPPFRWAYRGLGEVFIALAYGWLPVAVGYFIQARMWDLVPILVYGAPVAISIFLVILINEFPDYPADLRMNKRNLVVRLGRERAAALYAAGAVVFAAVVALFALAGERPFLFALPTAVLALANALAMGRGQWRHRERLEALCARTLIVNIAGTLLLTAGVLLMP